MAWNSCNDGPSNQREHRYESGVHSRRLLRLLCASFTVDRRCPPFDNLPYIHEDTLQPALPSHHIFLSCLPCSNTAKSINELVWLPLSCLDSSSSSGELVHPRLLRTGRADCEWISGGSHGNSVFEGCWLNVKGFTCHN